MKRARYFLFFLFLYCSHYQRIENPIHFQKTIPVVEHRNNLLAGVNVIDITPPPGMPLSGYSLNAEIRDFGIN